MRLAMPDSACGSVQIEGARTGAVTSYHGRIVTVEHPHHERALRALGAFPVNVGGRPSGGYRCRCGFRPYFQRCSRCGSSCEPDSDYARTVGTDGHHHPT